jgi:hypothetical protein
MQKRRRPKNRHKMTLACRRVNFKDPDWAKMGTCHKKSDEVDAILDA